MTRRTRGDYGPRMTKSMEAQLKKEIAEFDENKTRQLIERNAVGRPDIDLDGQFHNDPRSNPDELSEEDVPVWGGSSNDPDIIQAKTEIIQLLTFRQYQVWDLVMRKGLSVNKAAERLGLGHAAVSEHLKKAKTKVKAYYENR